MTLTLNPHRLVQPALEPVSLEEVKLFLRVEHDAEDALLTTLIAAAREGAERLLNLSCIQQRWQWETVPFCGAISLPFGPVHSVVDVALREQEASDWTACDSENYHLRGNSIIFTDAPASGVQARVTYEAGFGEVAADVPATLRHALLRHIGALYETRSAAGVVELHSLYADMREVRV